MGVKISALPTVVTPDLTDVFPIVQNGVTYKESFTQLTSLFANAPVNTNITSMTGLTGPLKAPTSILDSSGNKIVSFNETPVVSPVNYLNFENSATGFSPIIEASGTDPDVGIIIISKGNGGIALASENLTNGIAFNTGTGFQHATFFIFANTAVNRTVTFPDQTGTIVLATKANGAEAANAVTSSGTTGIITTSALTTAGGASYAITWTNTFITTASTILLSIMGGTNTTQNITFTVTAGSGTSTLTIFNNTAATALNGTILIGYMVIP